MFLPICFPYIARGPFSISMVYRTLYTYTIYVYVFRIRCVSLPFRRYAPTLSEPATDAATRASLAFPFLRDFPASRVAYLRIRKTYTYIYTIYVYVICISFLNTIISRKKFKFLLIFSDPNFRIFWNFFNHRNSCKNLRLQSFWKILRLGKSYKIVYAHMYPILCTLRPSHIFYEIIYVLCARTIISPKIDIGFWKILQPRAINV